MADLLDDHIDSTIDEIEADALAAYCTRIAAVDADGSAPPACLYDEPHLTDIEMTSVISACIIAVRRRQTAAVEAI